MIVNWKVHLTSYLLWLFWTMRSKHCNTNAKSVWTSRKTMLKNKPHLVKFRTTHKKMYTSEMDLPIGRVGHWPRVHECVEVHRNLTCSVTDCFKCILFILLYNISKTTISIRRGVERGSTISVGPQGSLIDRPWGLLMCLPKSPQLDKSCPYQSQNKFLWKINFLLNQRFYYFSIHFVYNQNRYYLSSNSIAF